MHVFQDICLVIVTTLVSLSTLFLLAKLIGHRQVAQLSMFDYINGITIGSIAAELSTNLEEWYKPFAALIIYALSTYLISLCTRKSIKLRRFMEGDSYTIYEKGILYEKNLSLAHLDMDEFLTLLRCQGYFDLQDIHVAMLEPNGKLSVLPKETKRPANPEDFGLNPTQQFPLASVVIDGNIIYGNLKATGNDEKWLLKQLHAKGAKDVKDIMLATCSMDNQVEVYLKNGIKQNQDIFE